MDRQIILHYHLFKNAGTSVDQVLRKNFGARWVTREFESRKNRELHAREVGAWVQENPDAVAFSSHTFDLPPPVIPGIQVIPVIFVRHPIDRIASAYAFEKTQPGGSLGAVLARNTTLRGYVEVRLAMGGDRQCRNFHASRFARLGAGESGTELERSIRAMQSLPFVGIVEDFGRSMERLTRLLKPAFPGFEGFEVSANTSRDSGVSLEGKVSLLRAELGADMYETVVKANEDDFTLYQTALSLVARAWPPSAA
jgi:hypothetical protein